MRKVAVRLLKGNEILAKDVYNSRGKVLIPAGSVAKKEYAYHFIQMGIDFVYIEDEISVGVSSDKLSEESIKESCMSAVKNTLERFSYNARVEELKIKQIIEEILDEILEEKNMIYNLAGVRQKSDLLYSHSINVTVLSMLVAINMKMSRRQVKDIAIGAMLHDIGYNAVTVKLDEYDMVTSTENDKKEMKKHVIYGYNMIENERWIPKISKDIILSHHEMCNGKGYPFKLDRNHISMPVKIVALCNEFDSLVYGMFSKPMKIHNAIEYIISQSGVRFDHAVVSVFNESVAAYPNGSIVETSDKDVGIVLRQNIKCPTRPVIRLLKDSSGNSYDKWVEKDLTEVLTLFITDTVETV